MRKFFILLMILVSTVLGVNPLLAADTSVSVDKIAKTTGIREATSLLRFKSSNTEARVLTTCLEGHVFAIALTNKEGAPSIVQVFRGKNGISIPMECSK